MIGRERDPDDGRGQWAVLTPAGRSTLRRMWPVYARELNATIVRGLDDSEASRLAALLQATAARLGE